MCLEIDMSKSCSLWWKLFFCRRIKCYKKVSFDYHDNIYSPYFQEQIWQPGWNVSNRELKNITPAENATGQVKCGIHVYTESVKGIFGETLGDIIEVWGYAKDFVAAGNRNEAVFTKVWLDLKEYERLVSKMKDIEGAIV